MFESSTAFQDLDLEPDLSLREPHSIESILLQSKLPDAVKTAHLTYSHERRIDAGEVSRLTHMNSYQEDDEEVVERLRIRGKALTAQIGSSLTCVLIRLPGVAYTVEVDAAKGTIAHWEWQSA